MSLGCFEMLLLRSVSMFGSAAVDELAVDPVVAGHAVGSDGGAISVVVGAVAVDIDRGCGVVVDHSAVGVNASSVHDDVVALILVVYGSGNANGIGHNGGCAGRGAGDEDTDRCNRGGDIRSAEGEAAVNFSAVHAGLEICDLESSRTLADHAATGKLGLECVKLILVTVGSDEDPLYAIIVYGIGHEGGGLARIVVEDHQEASFIGFSYIRLICSLIHDRWGTS